MSAPRSTPGPWLRRRRDHYVDDYPDIVIETADGREIVSIPGVHCEEVAANAHLIAAAPAMYEAHEQTEEDVALLLRALRGEDLADAETLCSTIIGRSRAALAQARGEVRP